MLFLTDCCFFFFFSLLQQFLQIRSLTKAGLSPSSFPWASCSSESLLQSKTGFNKTSLLLRHSFFSWTFLVLSIFLSSTAQVCEVCDEACDSCSAVALAFFPSLGKDILQPLISCELSSSQEKERPKKDKKTFFLFFGLLLLNFACIFLFGHQRESSYIYFLSLHEMPVSDDRVLLP